MRVKAMLMSVAGVILLTIGAAGVVVGGLGSFLKQNTIAVDRDGRVFDSEGNEIGADRRPLTMSPLRKLICEYIPQACNSPLDWVYWFAFFGGLGVASLGWNLKERGSDARAAGRRILRHSSKPAANCLVRRAKPGDGLESAKLFRELRTTGWDAV